MRNNYIDFIVRMSAYALMVIFVYLIFLYDSTLVHDGLKFTEYSATEFFQEVLFFFASVCFFTVAVKFPETRPISILAGGFTAACFCREFDYVTDFLNSSFWFLNAILVIITVVVLSWKSRKNFTNAFNEYYEQKAFVFMICGMLITFLFSRLFGKGTFWQALLEDHYIRTAKNAAEEGTELMGDVLIFISSAEYLLFKFKQRRQLRANK